MRETKVILGVMKLGFPWPTLDPFLFCVHHNDDYPAGNDEMGPATSLRGRNIGNDFEGIDGWRMYHGEKVPGFPQHPHRGFETVTIARRGYIDHSDSLGAAARFGKGDAQWLTAGKGIVHSEMFPLLDKSQGNPVELFQIWLNLPAADKFADPHFSMFWNESIPTHTTVDAAGKPTHVTIIAGRYATITPPSPPPKSWAARPDSDVAIWTIRMAAGATWTLPPATPQANRVMYFFKGKSLKIAEHTFDPGVGIQLRADAELTITNGEEEAEILLLQGKPIAEPVAQYGPFVMNSQSEIQQAFADYQLTKFGGWPWSADEPVHARTDERFARHADGRVENAKELATRVD